MLVCRWADVNTLTQHKFRSTIHLLGQYSLAQSHRWKYQINVWNLLKVIYKDTRTMSLKSFWYPHCWLQTHFTSCSSVFSVSIVDFEQIKSRLGSKSYRSKKPWYSSFVVRKKVWFILIRGKLTTCNMSKIEFFAKIIFKSKSLTNLTRNSILRFITRCWI